MKVKHSVLLAYILLVGIIFSATSPVSAQEDFDGPFPLVSGDVNNDGKIDLVYSVGNPPMSYCVRLGNGNGTFQPPICDPFAGNQIRSLALKDLDGDGNLDLVLGDFEGNFVRIHKGNGDGTFTPFWISNIRLSPRSLIVADFDGDGVDDIVTANWFLPNISFLHGNGDGTFAAALNYPTNGHAYGSGAADFNSDGYLDVVTANYGLDSPEPPENTVSLLLGNGRGAFESPRFSPVGTRPRSLVVGDFNGDGCPDVATTNLVSNNIAVLLGDCQGGFDPASFFTVSGQTQPIGLVATDFKNDGKTDLAIAFERTNQIVVLFGRGDGTFGGPPATVNLPVPVSPVFLHVADVNNDGCSDILSFDSQRDTVLVWLGDCRGGFRRL